MHLQSSSYQLEHLPYIKSITNVVNLFSNLNDITILNSGNSEHEDNRFDIITAEPNEKFLIKCNSNKKEAEEQIKKLDGHLLDLEKVDIPYLPFTGGAIGIFSYDFGRILENLTNTITDDLSFPLLECGIYLWAVITDHKEEKSFLFIHPDCDVELISKLNNVYLPKLRNPENIVATDISNFSVTQKFQPCQSFTDYKDNFHQIKEYILSGDCYQVNYAQRFSSHYHGHPRDAFLQLNQSIPVPFSAYLGFNDYALLCFSPERFIKSDQGLIETKPIKGTSPRSTTSSEDEANRRALENSEKDKAENLMIVDLLRNDLGKSCKAGSIHVKKLFDIESFQNVHHMVSTITGTLKEDNSPLSLLVSALPGGSITGAPKVRAMEVIEELEQHRRGPYCGSVFYISSNDKMDSNIAIRSVLCKDGQIHCWGGGGIVHDSICESEYDESQTKINNLIAALERISDC